MQHPSRIPSREIEERPHGYRGPNLDPEGLVLRPEQLGPGIFALMANQVPKDNNGVIIGRNGVLVVDAGINGAVAHQIQSIVRQLSGKPIRYLVNTTYHGDQTFGNASFPDDVTIISSRLNKQSMRDLQREKRIRSGNLGGNVGAIADLATWRRPDIVFGEFAEIDLGDHLVQLWNFGPGSAPGDTVVYVPRTKTAWTGNYLMAAGIPPMLTEGSPGPYIASLQRMERLLDVETIVPGHGPMDAAAPALENMIAYLRELQDEVETSILAGRDLEATLAAFPMSHWIGLPAGMVPTDDLKALLPSLHRLNVMATYREMRKRTSHQTAA